MSLISAETAVRQGWEIVEKYDRLLARLGFLEGVDEVAIYTLDPAILAAAVQQFGQVLEHFNSAEDHVHTQPFRTCYDVRYEFLRVPGIVGGRGGFRFECMATLGGLSPLHEVASYHSVVGGSLGAAVHASFKCEDEIAYATAVRRLREAGWEAAQKCESTYGRFSYWAPAVYEEWPDFVKGVWLKPRVNLRDAA